MLGLRSEVARVEGADEGVRAREEPVRVRVPDPDVERHEVRVPEVERGAGAGGLRRAAACAAAGTNVPSL